MTKKYSYNLNKRQIEVNGHYFALCSVADHGNIVRMLNHYEKENEWLKFKLKECREHKLYSRRELEKENEELKQFRNKVSELLTDEIKEENELLNYYLKEKAPLYANRQEVIIGVLKRLKKELAE